MSRTFYTREFHKPKNAARVVIKNVTGGEVFWAKTALGRFRVVGFKGRAQKPFFNYVFKSYDDMVAYVTKTFKLIAEREALKVCEQAAIAKMDPGVRVGDIFVSSWGYEQTNVNFYQVVELKGVKTAVIRRIAGEREYDGPMSGKTTPVKDAFLERSQPKTKRIMITGKKTDGTACVYFKIESFEYAYPYIQGNSMRFSEWH